MVERRRALSTVDRTSPFQLRHRLSPSYLDASLLRSYARQSVENFGVQLGEGGYQERPPSGEGGYKCQCTAHYLVRYRLYSGRFFHSSRNGLYCSSSYHAADLGSESLTFFSG